jgi:hypothetical protein
VSIFQDVCRGSRQFGAKTGSPLGLPVGVVGCPSLSLLESDPEAELQLTHANRSTGGRISLDVADLATVAAI